MNGVPAGRLAAGGGKVNKNPAMRQLYGLAIRPTALARGCSSIDGGLS
jgi:hypothetical protein